MTQVRAAYNADKRALVERVQELESALRQRDFDKQEQEAKLALLEQSAGQYRNEINFWNGKCSTLRRDVEYQERHLLRYKDENAKLLNENDYLKVRVDNMEREVQLLRRQVSGLQEDNDRINRMYQVVEREAVFSTATAGTTRGLLQQENVPVNLSYAGPSSEIDNKPTLRVGGGLAAGAGKWKVIEDDNFAISQSTGNFSHNQFYPTMASGNAAAGGSTIKRNENY